MEFSTVFITHQRQTHVRSLLAPETLARRLVDLIGGEDAKEKKNSLATATIESGSLSRAVKKLVTIPNEIWRFQW